MITALKKHGLLTMVAVLKSTAYRPRDSTDNVAYRLVKALKTVAYRP